MFANNGSPYLYSALATNSNDSDDEHDDRVDPEPLHVKHLKFPQGWRLVTLRGDVEEKLPQAVKRRARVSMYQTKVTIRHQPDDEDGVPQAYMVRQTTKKLSLIHI